MNRHEYAARNAMLHTRASVDVAAWSNDGAVREVIAHLQGVRQHLYMRTQHGVCMYGNEYYHSSIRLLRYARNDGERAMTWERATTER